MSTITISFLLNISRLVCHPNITSHASGVSELWGKNVETMSSLQPSTCCWRSVAKLSKRKGQYEFGVFLCFSHHVVSCTQAVRASVLSSSSHCGPHEWLNLTKIQTLSFKSILLPGISKCLSTWCVCHNWGNSFTLEALTLILARSRRAALCSSTLTRMELKCLTELRCHNSRVLPFHLKRKRQKRKEWGAHYTRTPSFTCKQEAIA